jgi:hypothetical protein
VNYSCGESKHTIVEASCCDRGRIVERGNAQRLSNNNKGIFAKLAISIFGLCWNMVTHTLRDQSTELYVEQRADIAFRADSDEARVQRRSSGGEWDFS